MKEAREVLQRLRARKNVDIEMKLLAGNLGFEKSLSKVFSGDGNKSNNDSQIQGYEATNPIVTKPPQAYIQSWEKETGKEPLLGTEERDDFDNENINVNIKDNDNDIEYGLLNDDANKNDNTQINEAELEIAIRSAKKKG